MRGTSSLHEGWAGSHEAAQLMASPGGQEAGVPPAGFPKLGLCLPTREPLSYNLALSLANNPGLAGRKED